MEAGDRRCQEEAPFPTSVKVRTNLRHSLLIPRRRWKQSSFFTHPDSELPPDCDVPDIPRIHCQDLSVEDFVARYERPGLPVIIQGIPEKENWMALEHWDLEVVNGTK